MFQQRNCKLDFCRLKWNIKRQTQRFWHRKLRERLYCPAVNWTEIFFVFLKDGETPLLLAVKKKHTQIVSLLLEKKADLSVSNKVGGTQQTERFLSVFYHQSVEDIRSSRCSAPFEVWTWKLSISFITSGGLTCYDLCCRFLKSFIYDGPSSGPLSNKNWSTLTNE